MFRLPAHCVPARPRPRAYLAETLERIADLDRTIGAFVN
jgi:hypothetical protein